MIFIQVKLADFGVSREVLSTQEARDTFVGTGLYMSPERFAGNNYQANSDVWSLGLTILECVLGYFPYNKVDRYLWERKERNCSTGTF